jgi:phage tail-like protein
MALLVGSVDYITAAAALDAVLSPLGAGCYARNKFAWVYSKDPAGTIEILPGGVNDLMRCETGEKIRRLPFGTAEGSYSIPVTSTDALGRVSLATFPRELLADGSDFLLEQPGEVFSDAVLAAANYLLTLDLAWCQQNMRPGYVPAVADVQAVDGSSVLVTFEQDFTPGIPYTLHVENVTDAVGNLITPNPSTADFFGYSPEVPAKRQFSLYTNMFAGFMRQQDEAQDFTLKKVCAILEEPLFQILADMDEYTLAKNPSTAPIRVVDALLETYGGTFAFLGLSEADRRVLLEVLVDLWRLRGTEAGIVAALRLFFGFTSTTFEYYWGTHWLLGSTDKSELGVTTVLNSSILRDRFSFLITVDRALSATERGQVVRVVEMMKTGHTHLIGVLEPAIPFVPDHWQLPWSELGIDTLLH